ncbi:MAG: ABC transporter ATP-binding protein [Candidatus Omnitrophica bacterium]|nr:ABC transporter ATP-binding protein [Candidatus Omnitrophota bacterium]
MTPAIAIDRLSKRYDTVTALAEISFEVQPGEIMGFLGPNGAGKTTTLRILTGLIAPTGGRVRIDGLDVAERSLEVRRRIGYLPEHVALYPELRVQEYLAYRAGLKGVERGGRRSRVAEAMERCRVAEVARQLIGRLSKGYRQRVALADCLLARPKILILDEPTIGLDPHQIRQTRELITELGRTTTILLSTHILPEVEAACHKVAIINKGRIIAVDTPQRLRMRLQGTQVVRVQLRGEPAAFESPLRALPGVARVGVCGHVDGFASLEVEAASGADVREPIYRLAVERRWALRELAPVQASLEEVFIHLTTTEPQDGG